jgi:hypothetical protein
MSYELIGTFLSFLIAIAFCGMAFQRAMQIGRPTSVTIALHIAAAFICSAPYVIMKVIGLSVTLASAASLMIWSLIFAAFNILFATISYTVNPGSE